MYCIENDFLKATFKQRGGELCSLIRKSDNLEFMWKGNPEVWGWHAPVLFPIVGGLKNNQLRIDGKSYPLSRHGFFRTSFPEIESHHSNSITFLLQSSEETKKAYPFDFAFRISFELSENSLYYHFSVTNCDNKRLFFALGGHPAFAVPFFEKEAYTDYYLEFEVSERLDRELLNSEGLFSGIKEPVLVSGNKLPLSYSLFEQDALVFKSIESRKVTIKSNNHSSSLSVSFPNFPYLGLWAKPGADFVCIEPWIGCADSKEGHNDISEKELVQDIEPGETFSTTFWITVES